MSSVDSNDHVNYLHSQILNMNLYIMTNLLILDEVPGMNVPLHTVYKLTPVAYGKFHHNEKSPVDRTIMLQCKNVCSSTSFQISNSCFDFAIWYNVFHTLYLWTKSTFGFRRQKPMLIGHWPGPFPRCDHNLYAWDYRDPPHFK